MCQIPNCTEHYGCQLRNKGISLSPRIGEERTRNWKPTPDLPPSHYKNIRKDPRPGGTAMPVLNPDGSVVRHRQAQRDARRIEEQLKARHNAVTTS